MLLNYNGASPEYHCQDIVHGVDVFYNISNLNMIIDHDFILLNQNSHQRKTLQWKIVESEGFGGLECFYPAFSHTSYFKIYNNQKENERKKNLSSTNKEAVHTKTRAGKNSYQFKPISIHKSNV